MKLHENYLKKNKQPFKKEINWLSLLKCTKVKRVNKNKKKILNNKQLKQKKRRKQKIQMKTHYMK